jgi:hypothetical protein
MKTATQERHNWTKKEIKKVKEVWDTSSISDIALDLKIEEEQVRYIAYQMRLAGVKLAPKRRKNIHQGLIRDMIKNGEL